MKIKRYASDLTDEQWELVAPHLPAEKDIGRLRSTDLREVVGSP
jgi:transposase